MIPNPIHKVLSTIRKYDVRALLMGGQACVFYGGAEFSRDADFAILADSGNLARLDTAMRELDAEVIAVPPFAKAHLENGMAVHFRCRHPEASGMRVDVMSKMRGVDPFPELWERRTTVEGVDGTIYELMALPDLVRAKKTQRDKDWPMIRRLIEADRAACGEAPSAAQVQFWLRESRTPSMLLDLAAAHPIEAERVSVDRPEVLEAALANDESATEEALFAEERRERLADRTYWEPLRRELELMRRMSR